MRAIVLLLGMMVATATIADQTKIAGYGAAGKRLYGLYAGASA